VIRYLPRQITNCEEGGDGNTDSEVPVSEDCRPFADHGADTQGNGEEGDRMLVGQAEAEHSPCRQPQARVAGSSDPHDYPRQRRPGQEIEGRGVQDVIGPKEGWCSRHAERAHQLGEAAPSELSG
jgi:hypothetical protein